MGDDHYCGKRKGGKKKKNQTHGSLLKMETTLVDKTKLMIGGTV